MVILGLGHSDFSIVDWTLQRCFKVMLAFVKQKAVGCSSLLYQEGFLKITRNMASYQIMSDPLGEHFYFANGFVYRANCAKKAILTCARRETDLNCPGKAIIYDSDSSQCVLLRLHNHESDKEFFEFDENTSILEEESNKR